MAVKIAIAVTVGLVTVAIIVTVVVVSTAKDRGHAMGRAGRAIAYQ